MKPITQNRYGHPVDIGFKTIAPGEISRYGVEVEAYSYNNGSFVNIVSDADDRRDHVIVNIGILDQLIDALSQIRDHHAARTNASQTPAPADHKLTADHAYHNIIGGEPGDLSPIPASHAWAFVDRVIAQITRKNPSYDPAHKARAANALLASMITASNNNSPAAATWKDGVGACAQRLIGLKAIKISEISEDNVHVIEEQLSAAFS